MNMRPDEMVSNYIKLRDYKQRANDEFKSSMAKVNLAMEKLEATLLDHLNQTGGTSLACDGGTVYKNMQYSATVKDQPAFLKWVREHNEWDALDLKANKTFVKSMAEETGAVPPGINFTQLQTVGVRRS